MVPVIDRKIAGGVVGRRFARRRDPEDGIAGQAIDDLVLGIVDGDVQGRAIDCLLRSVANLG